MKTAICAIVKNEHLYLTEWVEYHLNLGFNEIHIFEDKGSKSHKELITRENVILHSQDESPEIIEILSNRTAKRQVDLYNRFMSINRDQYDWVAFIDIDEFINLNENYTLEQVLVEYSNEIGILLSWKMMGASGHVKKPESGVVESYTVESELIPIERSYSFKSIANLSKEGLFIDPHELVGAVNTDREASRVDLCYDKIWINHYFTKSWEEWCNRIFDRGATSPGHRTLENFFQVNKDMEYLRKTLIESVSHKKPVASMWLDKENRIMVGGNLHQISKLNGKVAPNRINWPKTLSAKELEVLGLEVLISSKRIEISKLEEALASTDYHGHKTIDYSGTDDEYAIPQEIKDLRHSQRQEINTLREELKQLELQLEELKKPEIAPEIEETTEE